MYVVIKKSFKNDNDKKLARNIFLNVNYFLK